MAVYYDIHNLPNFRNPVLTVGTFDGVHKGHIIILKEVVKQAAAVHGESVLVTFDPHPRQLLFPHQPLGIITPLYAKLELIKQAGIDHVVVAPFTEAFSKLTATEYIEKFLVHYFHPKVIIIGYDHRFGHDRLGDINMLKHYSQLYHYELVEIPAQLIDEAAVSSTRIRNALKDGKMEETNQMLGRTFSISGKVMHGRELGRTLGFPTANIQPIDDMQKIPANGVYAIEAVNRKKKYKGMLNIGVNPTVTDKKETKIEAHLFDFDKDIYDEMIEVFFVQKMRDEQKFNSVTELKEQLMKDKEEAIGILKNIT